MSGIRTSLSADLTALLDESATLPPGTLQTRLCRARDEAVVLEARAAERDASVHRLIARLDQIADEIADVGHALAIDGASHPQHSQPELQS